MHLLSYTATCCYLLATYAYYLFTMYQRRWYRHVGWLLGFIGVFSQGTVLHGLTHDFSQPLGAALLLNWLLWVGLIWLLWRSMRSSNTVCLIAWLLLIVGVQFTQVSWNQGAHLLPVSLSMLQVHIILATLTSVLVIGVGIQAAMVLMQDRLLKRRPGAVWLQYLPSLTSMESFLFSLLALAVGALTVCVVVSGFVFFPTIPENVLWLSKLLIVWVAWLTFSVVLAGHYWFGWRATEVSCYTLVAVFLLIVVYVGSQWVLR